MYTLGYRTKFVSIVVIGALFDPTGAEAEGVPHLPPRQPHSPPTKTSFFGAAGGEKGGVRVGGGGGGNVPPTGRLVRVDCVELFPVWVFIPVFG